MNESYTHADVEIVTAATERHHIDFERTDADGHNPCVCGGWWDSVEMPGWDEHLAEAALSALAAARRLIPPNAWVVAKVAHTDGRSVTPLVLRNGWVRYDEGLSDPEHIRFFAAQLLAAADAADQVRASLAEAMFIRARALSPTDKEETP